MKEIAIIGSGFSSLSAACYLAKEGYNVNVYEKNDSLGGRARSFKAEGFRFDMGPSWYWMPDVFDSFFSHFNKKVSDFYQLERLDPSYRIFFTSDDYVDLPSNINDLYQLFESIEKGSSIALTKFLKDAEFNYNVAMNDIVHLPGKSVFELIRYETVIKLSQFFKNIDKVIDKGFENQKLREILKFPVLFLGAEPKDTPYFYCFMNHADLNLGTWYPKGGMYKVVDALLKLGKSLGVNYHTNSNVSGFKINQKTITHVIVNGENVACDILINGADYRFIEKLLPQKHRMYSEDYWNKRIMAPSSLLFYLGFNKKVKNVIHHNLFFDSDFNLHAKEIYKTHQWPTNPLFYANFTSVTDVEDAPEGGESCFLLMPISTEIEDSEAQRELYYNVLMERLEKATHQNLKEHVIFKKSFCIDDFKTAYNSFKGNAYGLANTLNQTAFLKPKMKNKTLTNFYNIGQLTVPGPGVPPALISGEIVSKLIMNK
jgi:phytoene desaturase